MLENHFAQSLKSLLPNSRCHLGIGVSGGADSLCLALLCKKFHHGEVTAVTVQAYWRDNEWSDIQKLSSWLKNWNIKHVVLSHALGKVSKKSEEVARKQRYQVLTQWCESNGVTTLLTGHNQEDQGVTFLMRSLRGSGVEGLSSMRQVRSMGNITMVRPLLHFPREAMRDFLRSNNQEWIDDPANHDQQFERNFLENFLAEFELKTSINGKKNLALSAHRIGRAQAVIEAEAEAAEAKLVIYDSQEATLRPHFQGMHEEILLQLVGRILGKMVGGKPFSLSLVEKCLRHLKAGKNFTMEGAVFLKKGENFSIKKEERRAVARANKLSSQ